MLQVLENIEPEYRITLDYLLIYLLGVINNGGILFFKVIYRF